jgi:nucleotide-binding universal stress UspA family protein
MLYKNILVPTDFSANSFQAYEFAKDLAVFHKANLHLIHVIELAGVESDDDFTYGYGTTFHEKYLEAEEKLRRFIHLVTVKDFSVYEVIRKGRTIDEILNYTRENNVELIIVSAHGKSDSNSLFLGETTNQILKYSKVPVVCLRSADPVKSKYPIHFKFTLAENWVG